MPHKRNPIVAERICGLARVVRGYAQIGLENVALWHERDISHSSAERIVLPDAFLAVDYMLDRFAWVMEGLVVRPERMRANLEATGGLFFSQRLLLALVESGLDRDAAYRIVQRHAMRAWDEGLDFRGLVRSDPQIASQVELGDVFDLGAYMKHVDTRCSHELSAVRPRGYRVSLDATHVASGKVRELYALDDGALALTASDRISTFDVVLPTPIPDKGKSAHGALGVLVQADARARPEPPPPPRRRRAHDGLPPTRDAADRVRRPRLSRRIGVEGLPRHGSVCGHALPEGLEESARLPEPIFTPATKAVAGHDENIDEEHAAALCGGEAYRVAREASLALPSPPSTRLSRDHRCRHEVRVRRGTRRFRGSPTRR